MKSKKLCLAMALAFATTMVNPSLVFAAASTAPVADTVAIVNKVTEKDTITVTGLEPGNIVKVYSAASAGTLLGSGTVATGATSVVISVAQVGKTSGNAYVTLTKTGETESDRTEVAFDAEPVTDAPSGDVITTENNAVVADIVKVTGLAVGDIVKVYDSNLTTKKQIGTATVATGKTEVSISIPKFPAASGNLYVSVTTKGKLESTLTEEAYVEEATTTAPVAATDETNQITITNTIKGDTVTVTGLIAGDTIKVYNSNETTKKVIGTIKVATGQTQGAIKIAQLGKDAGSVFVSVTTPKKLESTLTEKAFIAEPVTTAPDAGVITTANNAVVADTVTVTGLAVGDIVKVYDSNSLTKKQIGMATVALGKTEAIVNIPKFPAASGNVYVGVTSKDKLESTLVEKAYIAEVATDAPVAADDETNTITITNTIKGDSVKVTGLLAGDTIKVYNSNETTKKVIGTIKVAAGQTEGTIKIAQLGKATGSVFVSVTTPKKLESTLVEKAFDAEPVTTAPDAGVITTVNNAVVADTVTVTGLVAGDIVKVYNSNEATKKVIGTATVAKDKTEAIVKIPKFPSASGNVYVAVTSKDKLESPLVEKAYIAEVVTTAPVVADDETNQITITNTIKGDTVTVTGVLAGDTIKIYNSNETTKKVIGTIKVAAGKTEATIKIAQLGKAAGSVFISVTTPNKLESTLVEKAFDAEDVTVVGEGVTITTVNNAVIADNVKVTGLVAGDIVKVYNSNETTKKVIGTATVAKDKTEVTVNVPKFAEASGNVYVSVTSKDKLESTLVEKAYVAEAKTDAIDAGNIIIVNNTAPDAVILLGVTEGDIIYVYDAATEGKVIGKTAVGKGQKMAIVNIAQLGAEEGNAYITVTKKGKLQSDRVEKAYLAE